MINLFIQKANVFFTKNTYYKLCTKRNNNGKKIIKNYTL